MSFITRDNYTYENGVFKNKLGITDKESLRKVEYYLTEKRAKELLDGGVNLGIAGYNLERLKKTHEHLFQDVYEWAGKTRVTSLVKPSQNRRSIFVEAVAIEPYWELLEKKIKSFLNDKAVGFEQKREALTQMHIEANNIHPFPEGNGRSLQVFMKQLAREQEINLDYSKVSPQEWNRASAESGMCVIVQKDGRTQIQKPNHEPMREVFRKISSPVEINRHKNPQ